MSTHQKLKLAKIIPLGISKENKEELTLISTLLNKTSEDKIRFCQVIGIPWSEYERLLRKWSRVIARWGTEDPEKEE